MPIADPDGRAVTYEIRRNRRSKRLRLVVGPEGVRAVAPPRLAEREIVRFVESRVDWIEARQREIRRRYRTVMPPRVESDAPILLRGRRLALEVTRGGAEAPDAPTVQAGETIAVRLPAATPSDEVEATARHQLGEWLRREAALDAQRYVELHAHRLAQRPAGIRIKDQKTLWGSCGVTGVLHFNWRLIAAPPAAFEYVVVHELCHLERRDHSPAFWRRVEELLPGYREQRRWLRRHALALS